MRDFVMLSAFPKSGVTYLSSLMYYSFFSGEGNKPESIEKKFIVDVHAYPDANPTKAFGSQGFVKSHFAYQAENDFISRTSRAIYLIRDPIDVMHSSFDFNHLIDGSYSNSIQRFSEEWIRSGGEGFGFGTWINHVNTWTRQRDIPVLMVRYTDLVDHPRLQLDRIYSFIGVVPQEAVIEAAIQQSSMKAMRAREESEFANKTDGVFYQKSLEEAMAKGARFINKGYRNSFSKLTRSNQAEATQKFGPLIAKYLDPARQSVWRRLISGLRADRAANVILADAAIPLETDLKDSR